MKKKDTAPKKFDSLSELHRLLGLPKPLHPMISLVENKNNAIDLSKLPDTFVHGFYKISYKTKLTGKIKYGQGYYDFDEGGLLFKAPNQVSANGEMSQDHSGFTVLFHADFLAGYPLAKKIKQYGFFSYAVNEALHLSEKEKATVISIFKNIDEELNSTIDDFSQDVIISQLELLLNYSNRFYKRQFLTRKTVNNSLLQKLEEILDDAFDDENLLNQGIPTVHALADKLHLSPSYLSDMLRSLTGQNTQQHIHHKLIEKAKEKLSVTSLSVREIAYALGFEHSQSFSKFFKTKTNLSPLQFRASFN
ncbi:MAG: helix-turn-helix domain-containing protein [Cytophaga sp.]|uniref:helix-turn-helix domain-containing protein n=1 Tax=Cytophaga sp. TaxID=29535 RepID=UPI003F7E570E